MVFLVGGRVLLPARIHPGKTQCMERVIYEVNTEGIPEANGTNIGCPA
jgi:hypothetical protein